VCTPRGTAHFCPSETKLQDDSVSAAEKAELQAIIDELNSMLAASRGEAATWQQSDNQMRARLAESEAALAAARASLAAKEWKNPFRTAMGVLNENVIKPLLVGRLA